MRKFLKISIIIATILLIVVVAMSLQEQGTIKRYLAAQAAASFMLDLQADGIIEQSSTGAQFVPESQTQTQSRSISRSTTRTVSAVDTRTAAAEPTKPSNPTATATTPAPEVPVTPTAPQQPSWCPSPSQYVPIPPRPGTTDSPSGLCITESPIRNGKQTIKYCSLIGNTVMCYILKIDCSVANQPCKFTVTTPWGDIPSMFLPPVKCENPPAQPYDPSGIFRVKCTMDPSIYPQPISICYKVDPKTRGIIPVDCPRPPVTPVNPTTIQPTTPPNRDDAFPPVVSY